MREHDHLVEPLFAVFHRRPQDGASPEGARRPARVRRVAGAVVGLVVAAWIVWLAI